ncbi:hypothetical protein CFOL_v3_01236, partial [Cephalotus follicularis]
MTHETTMKNHENVEVKKKKAIAFKASKEDSESDEDGDVALITSQFKRFLKNQRGKKNFKKNTFKMKNQANGKNQHAMNARSPAISRTNVQTSKRKSNSRKRMNTSRRRKQWWPHGRIATPQAPKRKAMKKLHTLLTWQLRMKEDEVNFTFDELQIAYEKLYDEYENMCLKNKTFKKNAISLSK